MEDTIEAPEVNEETDDKVVDATDDAAETKDIIAATDVDDFAAFEKLTKKHKTVDDEVTLDFENDKPAKKKKTERAVKDDDPATDTEDEVAEPEEQGKLPDTDDTDDTDDEPVEGMDEALAAFQREGIWDDDEISEMFKKNPDAFVAKGKKLAKKQRDSDSFSTEFGKLKAEVEARKTGQPATEELLDGDDEEVSAIIERLSADELIGEDVARDFEALVSRSAKATNAKIAELEKLLADREESHQREREMQAIQTSRIRLSQKYESLEHPETFTKVVESYNALAATGKYGTVEDCFEAAVKAELSETTTNELKKKLLRTTTGRNKGQPRASSPSTPNRRLSRDEKDFQVFQELAKKHRMI